MDTSTHLHLKNKASKSNYAQNSQLPQYGVPTGVPVVTFLKFVAVFLKSVTGVYVFVCDLSLVLLQNIL